MTRTFEPNDLISLPRLDANQAAVLAQQLEAAALDDQGSPRVLPEAVQSALDDVKTDRAALQEALGGAPTASDLRAIDRLEDDAIAALFVLIEAWARLAGQIPEGDIARSVGERLGVDEGLAFVNLAPREEWGVVETKLQVIEREQLDAQLAQLGAAPLLAHLRAVHARYGEATGATKASKAPDTALVRGRYDALRTSLRHYAAAVAGSVQRKKPETQALAEALLKPLASWPSRRKRGRAAGEDQDLGLQAG